MSKDQEIARIRQVMSEHYGVKQRLRQNPWHPLNPISLHFRQKQEQALVRLVNEFNLPLSEMEILDAGCGTAGHLRLFAALGAQPAKLWGIDLMEERIEQALSLCPPAFHLEAGELTTLPYKDASFDLICQFTVFSSILDQEVRTQAACQMMRVLKPGGWLLWYDLSSARTEAVRGLAAPEVETLFNKLVTLKKVALHPQKNLKGGSPLSHNRATYRGNSTLAAHPLAFLASKTLSGLVPMRILYIANPNSSHTRRWVNWFAAQGHTVYVVADTGLKIPWPAIPVFDLPRFFNFPLLRWFIWAIWLRIFISRWKPDILHAHRVSAAGWLAAASGFHPQVVTPWGSDLYQHPLRSATAAWLARFVLRQADLVTADSNDLLNLAQRYGAGPKRCEIIQWGVDSEYFHPTSPESTLRQDHNIGPGPVIFSPRACTRLYNLGQIIEAIPAVLAEFPQAVFILRDYEADADYKAELLRRIDLLGVQNSVRWVGRIEPWEKVAELFQISDLAISIPASDGTPGSVLEAMACGIPIIASDLPSLREWIQDGQNGLLVPVDDLPALVRSILLLFKSPAVRRQFSARNLEIVQVRADRDVEMGKMQTLYSKLAQGKR